MLPNVLVEHSELLINDMQMFIFQEYKLIWDECISKRRTEVPSIYTIAERIYEVLQDKITKLLQAKYTFNIDNFNEEDFQKTVAIYSFWFDQKTEGNDYIFESLLHEMTKFFCLHQLFHERDGELINQPILEVW
jgi:hypothetical protein